MISAILSLSNLFLYCYYGKLASESFESMADLLYENNWPELPNKLKKYFILMIGNGQQPLFYHGFGIAVLNLETFSKVRGTIINQIIWANL